MKPLPREVWLTCPHCAQPVVEGALHVCPRRREPGFFAARMTERPAVQAEAGA